MIHQLQTGDLAGSNKSVLLRYRIECIGGNSEVQFHFQLSGVSEYPWNLSRLPYPPLIDQKSEANRPALKTTKAPGASGGGTRRATKLVRLVAVSNRSEESHDFNSRRLLESHPGTY
jgi:hypothetical protein